jgi:16S rRNA G966 N2-methylase RsmD
MSNLHHNILNIEVQAFIKKNLKTNIQKLILKGTPFKDISIQDLAIQIEGKNKSEKKLPKWYKTDGIIFPAKLNLEQASSEITAKYKSKLIKDGDLIDLTGGFGVDDYYFSLKANQVYHCEINPTLSKIVAHNNMVLDRKNIECIIGDSFVFLSKQKKMDTIYVDPSRRAQSNRVFLFKDCEPNVVENQDLYLAKAQKVIIKAAPMLDISAALQELKQVSEVHIVSVNNECKELLFVLEKNSKTTPDIFCALLNEKQERIYSFNYIEEKAISIKSKALKNFLYEPDAAILKAGFFKSIAQKFEVDKINPNTHLYTSENEILDFPGKIFKIIQSTNFQDFKSNKLLSKANVVTRNFDLKPEEIKKKFKIKDGGDLYLFFCINHLDQKIVIQAKRV